MLTTNSYRKIREDGNSSNVARSAASHVNITSSVFGKFEEYSVDMCVVADDILLVVFVTTVIFSCDEYLVVLPGTFDHTIVRYQRFK
jgi:hypothetical protein